MRLRKLFTGAAATIALSSGTVIFGGSASAAYTDCGVGYACLWQDTSYPGNPQSYFAYNIDYYGSFFNDEASSISNNGYCGYLGTARFYEHSNYTGASIDMVCPGTGQSRDPQLSNGTNSTSSNWNDRISSARFV